MHTNDSEVSLKRYKYNGKERDEETGLDYYGARYYASWLCRFTSVDPQKDNYPMQNSFAYAANSPVTMVDVNGEYPGGNGDGKIKKQAPNVRKDNTTTPSPIPVTIYDPVIGGPQFNPSRTGKAEIGAAVIVKSIAMNALENNKKQNRGLATESQTLLGEKIETGQSGYKTDTYGDKNNNFNMYVGKSTIFNVDESNSENFSNYEAFVVSKLLMNMIDGTGPENYNFPLNGKISSQFLDSDILYKALTEFVENNQEIVDKQFSFGFGELVADTNRNGTIFNITGLTGSGMISITQFEGGIGVEIFNITSITSGAFGKELFSTENYPTSFVRDPNNSEPTTYGNISQTFNLFITTEELNNIVNQ